MAKNGSELLNAVYKEIADNLGMDIAMDMYKLFKGQQICFPVRFFNPVCTRKNIIAEYDGTNIKSLAIKYNYSEKTIRRIIKENTEK
ncbi:MAG: Mor transcription activator family protein [Clostridia bacterium]|nr:Mor transcription activator family protein [Clostridia bacterium]